jgi:hypothetical protein
MRYTGNVKRFACAFAVVAASAACGGGDSLPTGPSPVTAEVEFRYVLTASAGSTAETEEIACAGQVRLQPSFWGFARVTMTGAGPGTWVARFEEVPVGRHAARVEAPEACAGGELFANGVLVSGSPVSSFEVGSDGSVAR